MRRQHDWLFIQQYNPRRWGSWRSSCSGSSESRKGSCNPHTSYTRYYALHLKHIGLAVRWIYDTSHILQHDYKPANDVQTDSFTSAAHTCAIADEQVVAILKFAATLMKVQQLNLWLTRSTALARTMTCWACKLEWRSSLKSYNQVSAPVCTELCSIPIRNLPKNKEYPPCSHNHRTSRYFARRLLTNK